MAADCEPTRARMLELIYGELQPEARAEVDAHVAGCTACRAELKALESTRVLARRTLAADQPPPRAHAAIMRAAATAARPAAAPVAKAVPAEKPSAWAWLRGKWTLPTFATVGAVAVFLLASRIFLEPDKTYQRGREGMLPAEQPPPSAAPATPAAKTAAEGAGAGSAAEREGVGSTDLAVEPAGTAELLEPRAPRRRPDVSAGSGRLEMEAEERPALPQFAPPPPAAPARRAAPRAHAAPPHEVFDQPLAADEAAPSGSAIGRERAGAGSPAAAADRADAPAAKARTSKKAEAPAAEELAASAASAAAPAPPRSAAGRESPVARADRLFAQSRWVEAAVAYRELLRDDPRNAEAPRWRQRLTACEAAARAP
ncbi:MAG TPA: zf-HC2 domain-containing protein [Polyangia bacterium]|nr:zf-HC2 domain-containing protein [Polyangia bacterium]